MAFHPIFSLTISVVAFSSLVTGQTACSGPNRFGFEGDIHHKSYPAAVALVDKYNNFPEVYNTFQNMQVRITAIYNAEDQASIMKIAGQSSLAYLLLPIGGNGWWIGATRADANSPFLWPNGLPLNYTNWASGEPNGRNINGTSSYPMCVFIGDQGFWYDAPCTDTIFGFVIECVGPERVPATTTTDTPTTTTTDTPTTTTTAAPTTTTTDTPTTTTTAASTTTTTALPTTTAAATTKAVTTAAATTIQSIAPISTGDSANTPVAITGPNGEKYLVYIIFN